MVDDEKVRIEEDSLGEVAVPADAYWGAQTQRAIENFPISGEGMDPRFVRALGVVKRAAAQANRQLELLEEPIATAIESAATEVIEGEHDDQFPVDVFQTGSGTSTNMNANEVIANRASEILNAPVHPNDHVNFGQSSNDVIPTAMHVAALQATETELLPALETLVASLAAKAEEFDDVVKTGRTHLQDATPVRLGQEFSGFQRQIRKGIERIESATAGLSELALGGTAVGTGLNTHPEFSRLACRSITEATGIDFTEASNHFEAQATHDAMVHAHAAVRTVSGSMDKIAHDLRLLASGPRNGISELDQPENQPGSSIMPGKINPVLAESINQIHARVLGNDATIGHGGSSGQLELNLYKPVIATDFLESVSLLASGAEAFATRFVDRLEANETRCAEQVERSLALATALNPEIGYDAAATVAKRALAEGKSVREVAVEAGYLSPEEAESVIDPRAMTEPGILTD
ncbi:MAG: class II fumarate hydratase [Halodesulfurarchaeum sp.]